MAAFLKFYIKESLEYEMTVYKICITCMKKKLKKEIYLKKHENVG